MTVARALPPFKMASARVTLRAGTSRMAVAAERDQKPPTDTPMRTRPIMYMAKPCAEAINAPDTAMEAVIHSRRDLRSIRRASAGTERLVNTANAPDTAIAWPAMPSLTRRSVAIGVSRLTGMNSEAMSAKTHSAMANTPLRWLGCPRCGSCSRRRCRQGVVAEAGGQG